MEARLHICGNLQLVETHGLIFSDFPRCTNVHPFCHVY